MNRPLLRTYRMGNPHSVLDWVMHTDLDHVLDLPELRLARDLHQALSEAHTYCLSRPRYLSWWDQAYRASLSVYLNLCQGYGKGRGYAVNDWMAARGELYEVGAALQVGPREVCDPLKPLVLELAVLLRDLILNTPSKS